MTIKPVSRSKPGEKENGYENATLFSCTVLFFSTAGWTAGGVIPEMEECMRSHTTSKEYEAVIKKYADPGIICQAMGLLVIKHPYVIKSKKEGSTITYTVEGITVGTSSEIPSDVVQVYKASWENGKIISIEFVGPRKR